MVDYLLEPLQFSSLSRNKKTKTRETEYTVGFFFFFHEYMIMETLEMVATLLGRSDCCR